MYNIIPGFTFILNILSKSGQRDTEDFTFVLTIIKINIWHFYSIVLPQNIFSLIILSKYKCLLLHFSFCNSKRNQRLAKD